MITERPANALLQSLTPSDWERVQPHFERFPLPLGASVFEMDEKVDWVVFPETGLLSIITVLLSGVAVETSIVGREGGVGFVEALGSGRMHSRVIVQIPGIAFRISPKRFREAFDASPTMRIAVHQQVELLLAEGRQAIACHSQHHVQERLSRWLLECSDLSAVMGRLPLTQEFLSFMLGVQRTSITKVAMEAQEAGLIRYSRGMIELLDRPGLERSACECRRSLQALRAALAPEIFGEPEPRQRRV